MDIGASGIVGWIASSTNGALVTYDPVFLLVGGLVLAVIVITLIISIIHSARHGGVASSSLFGDDGMDFDDTLEI